MCTYNGSTYVREQLDSIAGQTRPPDELIVCDDRSDDDTRRIVEAFASQARFPVRLYANEQTLGLVKNFERAIELCEGDVVVLSDQDDVWCPQKLARLEATFLAAPTAGVVFTDAEIVDEDLRPMGYRLWQGVKLGNREQELARRGEAFRVLVRLNVATGATMAFRSKFKRFVLPIPDGTYLIHDGWIALITSTLADAVFLHEPLIKYRQHPEQQSGAPSPNTKLNEQLVTARNTHPNAYASIAAALELVRERILASGGELTSKEVLSQLEAKMLHLRARAGMPRMGPRRLPTALRELLTLRYHRHSNGLYSFAKDLLLQPGTRR